MSSNLKVSLDDDEEMAVFDNAEIKVHSITDHANGSTTRLDCSVALVENETRPDSLEANEQKLNKNHVATGIPDIQTEVKLPESEKKCQPIESEKPKSGSVVDPAIDCPSTSSNHDTSATKRLNRKITRRILPRSDSSSDEDEPHEDNGVGANELVDDGDDVAEDKSPSTVKKSKVKRFKSSSSSSDSSHQEMQTAASEAAPVNAASSGDVDQAEAADTTDASSNDSFVSLDSSDSSSSADLGALLRGAPFRILSEDSVNGRDQRSSSSTATQGMAVLSKPPAKAKHAFVNDLNRMRIYGESYSYIRHCMGQLSLVRRFELSHKLKGHTGCVNSIHFNEGGSLLASGSDDLRVFIWDWQHRKKCYSFKSGHTQNVFQSKFLPLAGDTHLVTTSRDGQVRLAVLSSTGVCRSTRKVAQHSRAAHKLALLDSTPHTFISVGEDGLIISIDVRESKPNTLLALKHSTNRPLSLYSVHANPVNDFQILTSGKDCFAHIFDRRFMSESRQDPVKKFCPRHLRDDSHFVNITCAVYSHDGREIIASYNDEDIYLFKSDNSLDVDVADYDKRFQGHQNSATVKGVNFYGPESEFIVSGSDCGNIFFWDKETESIVNLVRGDKEGVVNCLEPHPNLPVMATSGLDHNVKIWFPTSSKEPDMVAIEKAVKNNAANDRLMSGDRMFSLLWRHISWMQFRPRADRVGEDEEDDDDDDEDDDVEDSDSSLNDDDDEDDGIQGNGDRSNDENEEDE